MKKIKQILSLVLSAALITSYAPDIVKADEGSSDVKTVTLNVSAQAEYAFLVPYQSITVSSDKAESYGYSDSPVVEGAVSALDVLVAMHENTFGYDFTEETKSDYLKASSGFVSKAFGIESYNFTFTINDIFPSDGVVNENYGGMYTGYGIGEAVVEDGDYVSYAFLQDDYWMDYFLNTTYEGKKLDGLTVKASESVEFNVTGYGAMWGLYPENIIEENGREEIEDLQFCLLDDKTGELTPIEGAVTDENGDVTLDLSIPGNYTLSAMLDSDYYYNVMPVYHISVAEDVESTIMDDLWLQYDFKELKVGDSESIYPRRVNQVNKSDVAPVGDVVRPVFNFEIVSGDSITLDKTYTNYKANVTAVKNGVTIVKVTYDPLYAYDKSFSGSYDANAAYVVFDVNDYDGDITIDSGIDYSSYDTIYFTKEGENEIEFKPEVTGAVSTVVSLNGNAITANEDGVYTAALENRNNIIGISATDSKGNVKNFYQTVDARKISINIENATNPDGDIRPGDVVNVSFNGITLPVYKLAGIYNPTMNSTFMKTESSYVSYKTENFEGVTFIDAKSSRIYSEDGEVKGYGTQYDITNTNTISLTFDEKGEYVFDAGSIFESWWGSGLGADKLVENGGKPNMDAPILEGYFSKLPEFVINVTETYEEEIARLKNEIETLKEKIVELNQEKEDLKSEIKALELEIKELESQLEELDSEIEELTKENEELKNANKELETLKEELNAANEALTKANETLKAENESLKTADSTKTDEVTGGTENKDSKTIAKLKKFASVKVKLKVKKKGKKAKLSWTKVKDADGYIIYRRVGNGKYKKIKTIKSAKKTKFTNKKLKKKKKYTYRVVAFAYVDKVKVFGKQSKEKTIKIK